MQDIWGGSLSITPLLRKVWNMQFILVCTDYNTSWKSNIPYPGVKYIGRRTCWREFFYFLNGSKDQAASKNICKGENESFPEDSRSLAPKWINQTNLVSCTCYNLPATCNPFCWQSISESEKELVFFFTSLIAPLIDQSCEFANLRYLYENNLKKKQQLKTLKRLLKTNQGLRFEESRRNDR